MRVAVIDSGVNQRHPHITPLAGGICISENGALEAGDFSDYLGHGTAVTAAIQEKTPDAEYFAVRLFQTSLRTNIDGLFNAIHWAIDQRVNVINLSLGTSNVAHASALTLPLNALCSRTFRLFPRMGLTGTFTIQVAFRA